ncbi:MAG: hypothetical protein GWP59_03660 [Chlamydiales bacterium]|nr:hypothetical protein [Chlamydiales bacterium]
MKLPSLQTAVQYTSKNLSVPCRFVKNNKKATIATAAIALATWVTLDILYSVDWSRNTLAKLSKTPYNQYFKLKYADKLMLSTAHAPTKDATVTLISNLRNEGLDIYKKLAARGNAEAAAKAGGILLGEYTGVSKDLKQAKLYFQKAVTLDPYQYKFMYADLCYSGSFNEDSVPTHDCLQEGLKLLEELVSSENARASDVSKAQAILAKHSPK